MLGENLKTLRKLRGYSQERLAEKINVSRQAVAKWEREETIPDLNNLMMIAQLFEVTLDNLVHYDEVTKGVSIPPKGKHMIGTVVLGADGKLLIPEEGRALFGWRTGDEILVLGDESQGIALIKKEEFLKRINDLYLEAAEGIVHE